MLAKKSVQKADNYEEIGEADSRSEQSCGKKERLEENDQRDRKGRHRQGSEQEPTAGFIGVLPPEIGIALGRTIRRLAGFVRRRTCGFGKCG